jgi:hypothetical protein
LPFISTWNHCKLNENHSLIALTMFLHCLKTSISGRLLMKEVPRSFKNSI